MSQTSGFYRKYPRKVQYQGKIYHRQTHGYVSNSNSNDWIAIAVMMSYFDDCPHEVTVIEESENVTDHQEALRMEAEQLRIQEEQALAEEARAQDLSSDNSNAGSSAVDVDTSSSSSSSSSGSSSYDYGGSSSSYDSGSSSSSFDSGGGF